MAAPNTAQILWQESQSMAQRYARRIGTQDAADLAQQAVVNALSQPAVEAKPGAYLEVVGRNLLADRWRHEACVRSAAGELERHTPECSDPERQVMDAEQRRLVRDAIREIPAELRRPLLLRFFLDLPYATLARRLGIGEITARTRVHRSLAQLRSSLASRMRALLIPFGWFKPAAIALVMVAHSALVPPGEPVAPDAAPAQVATAVRARASQTAAPVALPEVAAQPAPAAVRRPRRPRPAAAAVQETPPSADSVLASPPAIEVQQPDLTWVCGMPVASRTAAAGRTRPRFAAVAPGDFDSALLKTVDDL